jgi:hypothetical protein
MCWCVRLLLSIMLIIMTSSPPLALSSLQFAKLFFLVGYSSILHYGKEYCQWLTTNGNCNMFMRNWCKCELNIEEQPTAWVRRSSHCWHQIPCCCKHTKINFQVFKIQISYLLLPLNPMLSKNINKDQESFMVLLFKNIDKD